MDKTQREPTDTQNKKYPAVFRELLHRIEHGLYTESLPGVKQLAKEFDVNFMTVDKAIRKLENQGTVYRIARKGTYVTRSRNIAFCYHSDRIDRYTESVFTPLLLSAQKFLSENNCPMFIESSMRIKSTALSILKNRIDGMIIKHSHPESLINTQLANIPLVRVLSEPNDESFDHVTYNNRKIGSLAAQWLLKKGHKVVCYIGAQHDNIFEQRFETFINEITINGQTALSSPYDQANWEPRHLNIAGQMRDVFSRTPRPTAIFCPSDNEIAMIYDNLYKLNIRPINDIEIISCNNDKRMLEFCDPAPASIDIHMSEIGRLAAQRLLERINNPELCKRQDIIEPEIYT